MKNFFNTLSLFLLVFSFSNSVFALNKNESLLEAINDPNRNPAYSKRDKYRNPYETLTFFQINSSMHVRMPLRIYSLVSIWRHSVMNVSLYACMHFCTYAFLCVCVSD